MPRSGEGLGGLVGDHIVGHVPELDPDDISKARRRVKRHATDATDEAELLDALGIGGAG